MTLITVLHMASPGYMEINEALVSIITQSAFHIVTFMYLVSRGFIAANEGLPRKSAYSIRPFPLRHINSCGAHSVRSRSL